MNILTQQVRQEINAHYQTVRSILQDQASYTQEVKINNVVKYLAFVNSALDREFSRILHISMFCDSDTVMCDRMYPFCYLKLEASEQIQSIAMRCDWLMDGLREKSYELAKDIELEDFELKRIQLD